MTLTLKSLKIFSTKNHKSFPFTVNANEKGRYLFIHIPKNAGTSIAKSLNLEHSSHATIIQAKEQLGWWKYRNYFKFAFVRNPWDRFLSLYNYARLEESLHHSSINPDAAPYGKHLDYDLLKHASLQECAQYLLDGKLRHDETWLHWLPQSYWLLSKKGKIGVDFVGRYEHLDNDFSIISKRLGKKIELSKVNSSKAFLSQSYRDYYDRKTASIVADFYKQDIELFKYQF